MSAGLSLQEKPFLTFKKPEEGQILLGNERYEGFVKDLADLVADKLNFRYEIKLVRDGKYGSIEENGEWSGMIGELVRNEGLICPFVPITRLKAKFSLLMHAHSRYGHSSINY